MFPGLVVTIPLDRRLKTRQEAFAMAAQYAAQVIALTRGEDGPSCASHCSLCAGSPATATINGNTITGTYAAFNCTVDINGNLSLTRQ